MDVFPKSIESKLGFDVLRERLEDLTQSALGRDRLSSMHLSSDLEWIRAELERVFELQEALRFDDPLPLHRIVDIRSVIRRAGPEGSMIGPEDLVDLQETLQTARRLQDYFVARRGKYANLDRVSSKIIPMPELERRIDGIVDGEGRVRDDASPELRRLRRMIVQRQAELRETLQRELRRAVKAGYTTEEQPTIRNGRMVIPIRSEAKRKIEGFVQDTSASGQTVYIEPTVCLNLNNEVRELEGDERREVERILREITAAVRAEIDGIRENIEVLAVFDLLQSKARLSNQTNAVVPTVNNDGVLEIVEARNPVLQLHFVSRNRSTTPREVVPLNLALGRDARTLIITGPNAGGKTVAMKTVGLFALMISYGLPIPADERTIFSVFDKLLVDIGDEQSIEEDLSTFSSHISNLEWMLQQSGDRSLVLIDEAGTGTDPAEGGALAQAVLEKLTNLGTRTIATTHHGTLKVFAYETEGVENGSMEFDQATLSPTYRFQPGVPGSSYAFEIARRIGLDEDILERSRELAGEQKTTLEDLITTFESKTQKLDTRLADADEEVRQAVHERETYRRRAKKIQREQQNIRRQALEEAERILASANARIERTIREIREAEAERETTTAARKELERFRDDVAQGLVHAKRQDPGNDETVADEYDRANLQNSSEDVTPDKELVRGAVEIGDQVVLDDGSTAAEVLEIEGDEAVISFDSMRLRTEVARLKKVGGKRRQEVRVGRVEQRGGQMTSLSAHSRIDLRGYRVDEAIDAVMRLVDDALATNLDHLEILHGTGTGALRNAIHDYLNRREDVESFEEAHWDQGGAGVTRVRLA